MVCTPKMEYQVFLCIFQKNLDMATLGLEEMGKFLWEDRKKGRLSQFSKTKLRWPAGQTFFPTFKWNFSILFKPKVAIAKFIGKMQKSLVS